MNSTARKFDSSPEWEVKPPSREYLNLPNDLREKVDACLTRYPVRLGEVANNLGIKVLLATLPRGTSGTIGQENGEFVIRINRHEAKHRQRFTLAHEIAHFLLHRDRIIAEGGWSENILLRSGQPERIEYEANRLASDIVIPSDLLAEALEGYGRPITSEVIEDLAQKFGVSVAAMEIKLQML
jgi:Zn-dependent peptidase ImmA (M78 family)